MSWMVLPICIVALPLLLIALHSWRAYLCVAGVLNALLAGVVALAMWDMRQPDFDDSAGSGFALMMLMCAELVVALASSVAAALAMLLRVLSRVRRVAAVMPHFANHLDPPEFREESEPRLQ